MSNSTRAFSVVHPGFLSQLAAEPGLTLSADVNPSARTPVAASTTTERQGNAMPSTKLEGELAAQFQKVLNNLSRRFVVCFDAVAHLFVDPFDTLEEVEKLFN